MSEPNKLSEAELRSRRAKAETMAIKCISIDSRPAGSDTLPLLDHIAAQAEEILRLTEELRFSQDTAKDEAMFANEANDHIHDCMAEIRRLREALAIYADRNNWFDGCEWDRVGIDIHGWDVAAKAMAMQTKGDG